MRRILLSTLALALGVWLGGAVTPVLAQIITYRIDAQNTACWDQPAASLTEANAIKTRVTYDPGAGSVPIDVGLSCSGAASPFQCQLTAPVPMAVQTVGTHRILIEGANFDPIDNTYTAYAVLEDFSVAFALGAQPPQRGGNGKIKKIGSLLLSWAGSAWRVLAG